MAKFDFSKVMPWIDKRLPVTEMIEKHATKYPTPKNLNYWWEFGGIAMAFFMIQIVTGIFLAMHYKPDAVMAFGSVEHIMRDVNWGWLLRYAHAAGVSFFFAAIYIHMFRGMYYGSYKAPRELLWWIGVVIYLVATLTAFTGYLLPWGQMSFWGAQVITNLFTAFPIVGDPFVEWLRGGFVVSDPTLNRFYPLHVVLLPGLLAGLVGLHISALHMVGSGNPTGIDINKKKEGIPFHPYYTMKLAWFSMAVLTLYFVFVFWAPNFLMEVDNYIPANNLATPPHIVPSWYLLPFYAVLRAVPDKLLGVLAMFAAIMILFAMPYLDKSRIRSAKNRPIYRLMWAALIVDFIILAYVGKNPPEGYFVPLGQVSTFLYFAFFLSLPFVSKFEDKLAVRRGQEYLLDVGIDHNHYGEETPAAADGYTPPAPTYAPPSYPAPAPAPVKHAVAPPVTPPASAPTHSEQPAAHSHDRLHALEHRIEELFHMLSHRAPSQPHQPAPPPAPAPPVQHQAPVPPASDQAETEGTVQTGTAGSKSNWFEERKKMHGNNSGEGQ